MFREVEARAEAKARERVEKAIKITGWKATRLAKESGLAVSTLTRFLFRSPGYVLGTTTLEKVDKAVKNYIASLPDNEERKRLTIEYEGNNSVGSQTTEIVNIEVRGAVQAGQWMEATEWHPDDWQKFTFPRPGSHKSYFGLRVKGPSMNQVYPEDTILVCVPLNCYKYDLKHEDHIIVQRWDTGQVEATVKEFRQGPNGDVWLWPRSNHPEHQTPISLPAHVSGDHDCNESNEIIITAVVVADYSIRSNSNSN